MRPTVAKMHGSMRQNAKQDVAEPAGEAGQCRTLLLYSYGLFSYGLGQLQCHALLLLLNLVLH